MFTRDQIKQMKEDELRTKVLIPLFKAMGFKDVFHYHGGTLELGKDIVMWKEDEDENRKNYALVVKANSITGKVKDVSEVDTQIRQCFGEPYIDPINGSKQNVNYCYLVSSQEIKKEAIHALEATLRPLGLAESVEYFSENRLWELIEKYLKQEALQENIKTIQQISESISPYYKIEVQVSDKESKTILKEKYPGASDNQPITFTGSFITPKTPEGDRIRKDLDDFFKKGTPVEIEKQFFKGFELPNFITQIFGESETHKIKLESSSPKNPIRVRIDVFSSDETLYTSYYDELVTQRHGKEEAVLASQDQSKPFQFEIVLNSVDKTGNFGFNINLSGNANVKQWLDSVLLNNALAKGETIVITILDTGIELVRSPMKNKQLESFPEGFIQFLDDLVFIQTKTKRPIMYTTSREITDKDEEAVYELKHILATGQLEGTWGSISAGFDENVVAYLLNEIRKLPNGSIPLTFRENQSSYKILDTEILLGPREIVFENAIIESSIEELENSIKSVSEKDILLVKFIPSKPNSKALTTYKNWLLL